MTSQNLLIRKFQVARLPTSSGLAGSLLADSEEFGQRKRCWEKSYCYFYLSAGHRFLGERSWRKYDVLSWGGAERRWWWRSGNGGTKGERETTNCRSCSDCISHARSTPDGRTDLRGFGCVLCHSLPRKIDSELTRSAYTPPSRFLTPLFDILVVHFICIRVHGPTCIFLCFSEAFEN